MFVANPFCRYVSDPFPLGVIVASQEFMRRYPRDASAMKDVFDAAIDSIRSDEVGARKTLGMSLAFDSSAASNFVCGDWWKSSEVKDTVINEIARIIDKER